MIGLSITLIIFIDSTDLRNKIGQQAKKINELIQNPIFLKENIGHSFIEAFSGIILNFDWIYILNWLYENRFIGFGKFAELRKNILDKLEGITFTGYHDLKKEDLDHNFIFLKMLMN